MNARRPSDNYDRIARFYDVDMASNMSYDDIGFYAEVSSRRSGRVLELGCGNGRILLELLARGMDIIGVDGSAGMLRELRRKAAARKLVARVARMDLRALALAPGFDVVLCPYSLVTYLTAEDALDRLLQTIAEILSPGGLVVVDAFVPRPVVGSQSFTLDYERPYGTSILSRWKRIVPMGATNRIERRYHVQAANGAPEEDIEIAEEIRPYSPETLTKAIVRAGYHVEGAFWDYAAPGIPDSAQFFTVIGSKPVPHP